MSVITLIIDMQVDFFGHDQLKQMRASLSANINALVRTARLHETPIIWIQQIHASDLADGSLEIRRGNHRIVVEGTPGAQLLPELEPIPSDLYIIKKRYSAFFGTNLDSVLQRHSCTKLIVAGINTHACIRTTVIDAYQRDLEVVMAQDCIGSHDLQHHEVSLRYMDGKLGISLTNKQIFRLLHDQPRRDVETRS